MKVRKRIISLFLVILLSLTLIPTTAFAKGFWDVSAGGGGLMGTPGGGKWSAQMQGLRITIIDKYGNKALNFSDYPKQGSTDILYSLKNTTQVDLTYGGCKALKAKGKDQNLEFENRSDAYICGDINNSGFMELKNTIGSTVSLFEWINDCLGGGWRYVAPNQSGAYSNFKKLWNTRPVTDSINSKGEEVRLGHGEEIRNYLYGDADAKKPKDDAA